MAILSVEGLTHTFGGLRAVDGYGLELEPGQVRGLIGPNGAGKTTVFNLIAGIHRPDLGRIVFDGRSIAGRPPYEIAALGLARTFQNLRLWRHSSVLEHVMLARYAKLDYGLVGAFFGTPRRARAEAESEREARRILERVGIDHLADHNVTGLPYGVQRRVELARAMAIEPKVLLLDEPTAGMNPEELRQMTAIIRAIHAETGTAIVLIEHRLRFVMELCERIQVLVFGTVIADGTPEEVRADPAVVEAYLGKDVDT